MPQFTTIVEPYQKYLAITGMFEIVVKSFEVISLPQILKTSTTYVHVNVSV